jgi:hypothetical protein
MLKSSEYFFVNNYEANVRSGKCLHQLKSIKAGFKEMSAGKSAVKGIWGYL